MEMLYEIGLAINESLDPTYVAQSILDRALVMVDARGGLLLVRAQEAEPPRAIGQVGLEDPGRQIPEILEIPEVEQAWQKRQLVQCEPGAANWGHLCVVPLESRKEVTGLLVVADREHREGTGPFSESDETLLRSFAYQAGAALHNARLHDNLEQAYEQLQVAQKELAQMEQLRALGNLAADMAHAMSHILGIIIGRADLYLNVPRDPEQAMQAILEAAEGGQSVIDRIRQFTRLGVGRKRTPVAVHGLLLQALEDVQALWRQRSGEHGPEIRWESHLTPLPETYANPTDLREVVSNLLINALEAMPDGGRLELRCSLDDDHIVFEVSDTGIGLSEEARAHLFEPFHTTKEGVGTGLGLSIVYRIVHDHEGEVEAHGAPGEGSRFVVRLPVRSEAPPVTEGADEDVEADFDR